MRSRAWRGGRHRGSGGRDRGSMAVELVVAAPAFAFLLLLVSAGGQWLNLTGAVGSAARDAAREASVALSYPQAEENAQAAVQADLSTAPNRTCTGGYQVNVQMFQNGAPVNGDAAFATATDLEVTVTCQTSLAVYRDIGFRLTQTFSDTAAAPLDPFVDRG